ncbi:MAG: dTDP-4-dehydrorhamnose 3,5-epimerase family protein [Cyclobacteriaceae bacterium]
MEIIKKYHSGAVHFMLPYFKDSRGSFIKLFNSIQLLDQFNIRQVNYVVTMDRETIRGLHFQKKPFQEAKIFRVLKGRARFVFCNIDSDSKYYKRAESVDLDNNTESLYIPRGFATGYEVLEECTEICYFSDNDYHEVSESGIRWSDRMVAHLWKTKNPNLSDKDKNWKDWIQS